VFCQRLVLVGDAHLGRRSPDAERAFLAFLNAVPSLGDGLVVTGDLFDFWFSYRRAVPRQGSRVAAGLAALRRQVPVLLVGGNHDRWGADFWQMDLGLEFAPGEGRLQLGEGSAVVIHGDGITETDVPGRVLHRLTRHPATIALFGSLHPDLGLWLVEQLGGALRERPRDAAAIAAGAARQQAWARARLAADPTLGLVAMGHTHTPAAVEVEPGRFYVNPGAWFEGYRYAVVGEGSAELRHFIP
jgi:UDP-2,3-diacylglucosamine hydrolase